MRFSPPPFAGPDAPPPFAAVAAAAFGLATLAAAVASGSGPDAAEAFPALRDAGWNLTDGSAKLTVTFVDGMVPGIAYSPSIAED